MLNRIRNAGLSWKVNLAPAFLILALIGLGIYALQTLRINQASVDALMAGPVRQSELASDLTTAIWAALAADEVPPPAEMLPEAGAMLVWRSDQVSRFRAIDQIEEQALLTARAGRPFADLCEAMIAMHGQERGIAKAGQLLGQWLADGLVIGVEEGRAMA